jgi:hypothetical protein
LAIFTLPADDPVNDMQQFKYTGKDTFRRVRRDDGSLGEELRFERDASGKVIRMINNNNYENRLK